MMLAPTSVVPLSFAPTALIFAVLGVGALVGVAVTVAARWGARQARTARAIAEAAGQLVVVRAIAGGPCTPLCVPRELASLLAGPVHAGEALPPWLPEVAVAVDALAQRVMASSSQSATFECHAEGRWLRLVGARIGDGAQLLVSLAEAGPDVTRVNRLESAALLSSGVAHDLLNVLNTLVLHADVGHDRAGGAPAARTHFDRIRIGSTRAAELVSLLRRYLRGEPSASGAVGSVRVGAIVEEVAELLRPTMPRALELTLAIDADATVVAQAVHLHQVVFNLMLNAVQALDGRPAPRIAISVAVAEGAGTDGGRADGAAAGGPPVVELVIADNGPGIPAALRERCFAPYVTTKSARRGTGLGLAVVRALVVDTLGGTVTVEDTSGGGARFVVRLPAAANAPSRPARANTDEHEVRAGR